VDKDSDFGNKTPNELPRAKNCGSAQGT
jgi:hypothetical protein